MFSARLTQAIEVGLIEVDEEKKEFITLAPVDGVSNWSDEDWLLILRAAQEVEKELFELGYSRRPTSFVGGRFATFRLGAFTRSKSYSV